MPWKMEKRQKNIYYRRNLLIFLPSKNSEGGIFYFLKILNKWSIKMRITNKIIFKTFFIIVILLLNINFIVLSENKLNVACAANLKFTLDEIKSKFSTKYPEIDVEIITASSGKLTAQIINGAPYDLFLSADMDCPQKLYNEGFAQNKPMIYCKGNIVVFTTRIDLDLTDLEKTFCSKEVKTIAIANPELAPYGKAALDFFNNINIYENIKEKLIYGENVSQTLSFILSDADIGFIPKSYVLTENLSKYTENINWIEINSDYYSPINQGIIIIKNTNNLKSALVFYDFIFSGIAKKIFIKYGYSL
jgi:molybdate transport system substrate-binding protein